MSDPVWVAIIAAAQAVIIAGVNALVSSRNRQATKQQVAGISDQVKETHAQIDGRMEQLIVASKAQGAQDQRAEDRQDAKGKP